MSHEKILFVTILLAVLFCGNESKVIIKNKVTVKDKVTINNETVHDYEHHESNLYEDGFKMDRRLRPINTGSVPDYYDWREKNMVTPVKDQSHCEACWAFSAVANIESHLRIYKKLDVVLSEQFLIDCDDTNQGCAPAPLVKTFANIVARFGGVLREEDYHKFNARRNECRWNFITPQPVPVIGFRRVFPDENIMAEYIFRYGPISAAINSMSMRNKTKKFNYIDEPSDEQCPPSETDHSVLIVGYNVYVNAKTGQVVPYWIIKNSWGEEFGDKGYYYLVRGHNACGISTDVSFAYVG